jgi:hypothetical protein
VAWNDYEGLNVLYDGILFGCFFIFICTIFICVFIYLFFLLFIHFTFYTSRKSASVDSEYAAFLCPQITSKSFRK